MLRLQLTCYVIFLIAGLSACRQDKSSNKHSVHIILPDSSKSHKVDIRYRYIRNIRRELNLKDLEQGVDSVEFRLYERGAFFKPNRLFVIKHEKGIWTCTLVTYWDRYPLVGERNFESGNWRDELTNSVVDSFQALNIIPKCRWTELADSLRILNIAALPSQRDIPNFYDGVSDGMEYHFEIATKNYYKFFSYHNPEVYKDKDNKSAMAILELISRQLSPVSIEKWPNGIGE